MTFPLCAHSTERVIFNPTEVLWMKTNFVRIIANVNEIICWQMWASPPILCATHRPVISHIAPNVDVHEKLCAAFRNTHNSSRFHFYGLQIGQNSGVVFRKKSNKVWSTSAVMHWSKVMVADGCSEAMGICITHHTRAHHDLHLMHLTSIFDIFFFRLRNSIPTRRFRLVLIF